MRIAREQARALFATASVARLATVDAVSGVHLVPLAFAIDGDTIFSAVDAKPKSTTALRRLANVRADPHVSMLADHYSDDWAKLWWVRADGVGRVLTADDPAAIRGVELLVERYEQYKAVPPAGEVLVVDVDHWAGWRAS